MSSFSIFHWLLALAMLATAVVPSWLIVKKAGYHGAFSLLSWIPLVNLIFLWVFALSDWPANRK